MRTYFFVTIGVFCLLSLLSINTETDAQKLFSNPRELSKAVILETKPVSHAQLVKTADRAFVGTIQEVEIREEVLYENVATVVRTAVLKVEDILFDETDTLRVGESIRVRSLSLGSRPVATGEKVLWFLAPDSELGLTEPVGIDSGHFRILQNGDVINLKSNANLLNPTRVIAQTDAIAEALPGAPLGDQIKRWAGRELDRRASGRTSVPVPYDLLLARTKLLHDAKVRNDNP